jgi:hypothetical protein
MGYGEYPVDQMRIKAATVQRLIAANASTSGSHFPERTSSVTLQEAAINRQSRTRVMPEEHLCCF